jgi:Protein of unknown function (DUF3093)
MRVYHERLRVPLTWWLVGLITIVILATEVVPGWPLPVEAAIYVVLVGGVAAMLLNWSRPSIEVSDGELRVGAARLPLAAVGEVTALDEAQTRSLRGPRGDPAAFLFIRSYLRQAVYVEVTGPVAGSAGPAAGGLDGAGGSGRGRGRRPWRRRGKPSAPPGAAAPYWLVSTRHPAELAAAINGARPAARADGATVG